MSYTPNTFPFALPHIEWYPRRIRAYLGGKTIVDSRNAKLVWEIPDYPYYYFGENELPKSGIKVAEESAQKVVYDIEIGGKKAPKSLILYREGGLKGLFTVVWESTDHWFEEDEEVFVHPKDPYKRADVLQSSRHVRVEVDGIEVANTRSPRFLYETMLPVRTYIPKVDCRLELFEGSELVTRCPYKGEANYYHINLPNQKHENYVWWHKIPVLESSLLKGYVSFLDEKVDIWIDGVKQTRPETGV
ncbi:hypothetical protein APHAL10511_004661 [Amanita phalloides]|nr:hypothetical protein APHAL10511_004661 [Amanita phalloides]